MVYGRESIVFEPTFTNDGLIKDGQHLEEF